MLKRIGELPALRQRASPFAIVTGASAGAINGSMVAATAAAFAEGTQRLAHLWGNLSVENVSRALIDIGYNDADARIDEVESFVLADTGSRRAAR